MKKVIAFNTLAQVIGKFISGGTTLAISILLARNLGPVGYGDFVKITTFVSLFYLFADFGLNAAFIQKETGKKTSLFQTLLTTRVVLSLALMFLALIILVFLPFTNSEGYTASVKLGIILFIPSLLFQSLITTANALFQKTLHYEKAMYATIAGAFVSLICITISTLLFLPSVAVFASVLSLLLGAAVSACVSLYIARRDDVTLRLSFHIEKIKNLLLHAFPLGITLIFSVIYSHVDSIILTVFRSTYEVGVYGLAYKFFELTLVFPVFFVNALFPLFVVSSLKKKNDELRRRVKKSALILLGSSLIVASLTSMLSPYLSLIRPEFSASSSPLQILLLSLPVFYLSALTMWLLVMYKLHTALMLVYGLSMVGNVIANLLLVPSYGYMASAWITVVSECIVFLASYVTIQKHIKSGLWLTV